VYSAFPKEVIEPLINEGAHFVYAKLGQNIHKVRAVQPADFRALKQASDLYYPKVKKVY
jgi:hypothetical protein